MCHPPASRGVSIGLSRGVDTHPLRSDRANGPRGCVAWGKQAWLALAGIPECSWWVPGLSGQTQATRTDTEDQPGDGASSRPRASGFPDMRPEPGLVSRCVSNGDAREGEGVGSTLLSRPPAKPHVSRDKTYVLIKYLKADSLTPKL